MAKGDHPSVIGAAKRAHDVGLATGFRVVPLKNAGGTAGACQVQQLERNAAGAVVVGRVWPGDAAHLALWNALMSGEGHWGTAPALMEGGGNRG